MNHARTLHSSVLLTALALILGGCTSLQETYPGKTSGQVWTAMVASANNPDYYPDWHVTRNDVWVDEPGARIEIHRVLERDYIVPLGHPQHQSREWQQRVVLATGRDDQPVIEFTSRNLGVPAKAREEAMMFFADVWELLGGRPEPAPDEANNAADESIDVIDG
jgi:hypothetical protein